MLPQSYKDKMKTLLKDDYEAYEASFKQPTHVGLRVNTLKLLPSDFHKERFSCEPIPWCNEGFYYDQSVQPAKDPMYNAGLYYIQEPSAMTPASFLDIDPGDKVLDLCAAPGGKSTHLGAKLEGRGILVSNDISVSRTKALLKNIETLGITNAIVTAEKPEKLAITFEGFFDKVLVDAPCSGEGMFRKDHGLIKSWERNGVQVYHDIQRKILPDAIAMLKPGGLLMYSTCTFDPIENECIIEELITNYNMEMVELPLFPGFDMGHPEWAQGHEGLAFARRLWPHRIKGEGHFLALMRKKGNAPKVARTSKQKAVTDKELETFNAFCKENLLSKPEGIFSRFHDGLYVLPVEMPDLKGIRLVRQGWYLGELKKNRFEPSQAFAMGLKKNQVKHTMDMTHDDIRVMKYLKGETINSEGNDGWVLVCMDGFPLGWGKRQRGKIKNKLAKTWRCL